MLNSDKKKKARWLTYLWNLAGRIANPNTRKKLQEKIVSDYKKINPKPPN